MNDAFRAMIEKDISSVFLNTAEIADLHNINGTDDVPCAIDSDTAQGAGTAGARFDGAFKAAVTLFIDESFFPEKPAYGKSITIDRIQYRVIKAEIVNGLYEIALEAVR
jgi:hypothetical protein